MTCVVLYAHRFFRFTINKTMETVLSVDVATKTLSFAVLEIDTRASLDLDTLDKSQIKIVWWEVIDAYQEAGMSDIKKPTIADAVFAVTRTMMKRSELISTLSRAVIETQPMRRGPVSNPRSKCLSHVIQCVLVAAGVPVSFRQPTHKFGVFNTNPKSLKYAARKKWAVETAQDILLRIDDDDGKWAAYMGGLRKKDDAADSLLQGVADAIALCTKSKRGTKRKHKT